MAKRNKKCSLEVLAQLANAEIARTDVVTRVLTVVCEFIFSGLPLHLKAQKKKKQKMHIEIVQFFSCIKYI
jgi:hypothetical protein